MGIPNNDVGAAEFKARTGDGLPRQTIVSRTQNATLALGGDNSFHLAVRQQHTGHTVSVVVRNVDIRGCRA